MSHWYSIFKSSFFTSWVEAGLPDPSSLPPRARAPWSGIPVPPNTLVTTPSTGTLEPEVLESVYGFGAFVGRTCGGLFLDDPGESRRRADWCGRFNLGISLFDHVCDELPPAARRELVRYPAFAVFAEGAEHGSTRRPDPELANPPRGLGDLGTALNALAVGVLRDLGDEIGRPTPSRLRRGMWRAMTAMYDAQLTLSATPLRTVGDHEFLMARLRLKSAEPFRIMAEWMARAVSSGVSPRRAAAFGRALGDCYWLIDDAKDLWDDLEAGRWNHFLVLAMQIDPGISPRPGNPVVETRVARALQHPGAVNHSTRCAVRRLARAMQRVAVRNATPHARRLTRSMVRWYS